MNGKAKRILLPAALTVAVAVFFAVFRRGYLHYLEHNQIFEWTWSYVGSTLKSPCGFFILCREFFSQFCFSTVLGAVLMALLPLAVWGLARVCRLPYGLSFIPAGLCAIALAIGTHSSSDRLLYLDHLCAEQEWDKILSLTDGRDEMSDVEASYRNIALAAEGRLLDELFSWPVGSPRCLMPEEYSSLYSNFIQSEIFWRSGLVNASRRFAFEAQQAFPDHRPSARCYMRLAECEILSGRGASAMKFITPLSHTLLHRAWAQDAALRARGSKAVPHSFDDPYNSLNPVASFERVYNDDPSDYESLEYLFATSLLDKNLSGLEYFETLGGRVPRYIKEAMLVRSAADGTEFPACVDDVTVRRFAAFASDMKSSCPLETMIERYSDTYWLYYYYRKFE